MKKLLTIAATVLALTLASATANANTWVKGWTTYSGDHVTNEFYLLDDDGQVKGLLVFVDGAIDFEWYASNPNPEDSGKGTGDPKQGVKDALDLAKQKGGGSIKFAPDFWTSPAGKYLASKGRGPAVINPNPEDAGGGHHTSPTTKKSPEQILKEKREEAVMAAPGKTFEVQPDAGSPSEQLKGMAGKKGQKGGDSKPDKKDTKAVGATFGDLPGPPELVNPAWASGKTTKAKAKAQKSKTKTGVKATEDANIGGAPEGSAGKTKTALKCAPNMTPGASGKTCVPNLDTLGSDSALGSSPGAGPGASAGGGAAGARAGRR